MSWRTTRSASSSNSVGSRLMMTRAAPLRLAISGNPAAGHTTSDEPMARNRSQLRGQLLGALHRIGRHRLPERHGRGLDVAAAGAIRRALAVGLEFFAHPGQFVALGAVEADGVGGIAVQFDDILGRDAGGLMQIVDVLRHQRRHLAGAIEAGERPMAAARLRLGETLLHDEAPPPGFVAHLAARHEGVERDRLVLGPQAAGRAEIRNAAFGRDPGPGEGQIRPRVLDQVAQPEIAVSRSGAIIVI